MHFRHHPSLRLSLLSTLSYHHEQTSIRPRSSGCGHIQLQCQRYLQCDGGSCPSNFTQLHSMLRTPNEVGRGDAPIFTSSACSNSLSSYLLAMRVQRRGASLCKHVKNILGAVNSCDCEEWGGRCPDSTGVPKRRCHPMRVDKRLVFQITPWLLRPSSKCAHAPAGLHVTVAVVLSFTYHTLANKRFGLDLDMGLDMGLISFRDTQQYQRHAWSI